MHADGKSQARTVRIYLNGVCVEVTADILEPSTSPEIVLNEYHGTTVKLILAHGRVHAKADPVTEVNPSNRKLEYLNITLTAGILLVSIIGLVIVFR